MWDGTDRRRFVRAQYPCLITLRKSTPPPQAILTHTEDISITGLCLISSKKIEAMTEVDLEIDLKDTLPNVILKGKVSWVKEISSGQEGRPARYNTGIRFLVLKDEDRRRIQKVVEHILSKRR